MMRDYRLWAGVAAVLIASGGVLSVTVGGAPSLPPPVAVRGATPTDIPVMTDGLELVPPRVVELMPSTSVAAFPEAASADSPDRAPFPASEATDSPDEQEAVSETEAPVDSPDAIAPPAGDSPDSPDSADSPDD